MSPLPKSVLKTFFEIGDRPTQQQFSAFIDSTLNLVDDRILLGLKEHNTNVQYTTGDTVLYNGLVYKALVSSLGAFIPSQWEKLSYGAVNYAGTWDAAANDPAIANGVGNKGDYYVVSVAGTTLIDGVNDWAVRDWIVFNGTVWEKVDNTDISLQTAAMVSFDNSVSGIIATNVQDAIDEVETRLDTAETAIDSIQNSKANKPVSPVSGNFAGLDSNGNLLDMSMNPSDLLPKGNLAVFNPSLQYDPATKDYVDVKFASVVASGVKFVASGNITSINVQAALEELDLLKQDDLGFTPVPETRTVNSQPLSADITLTKSDIGLSNVPNTDATNPANISQNASYRFATDAEKTAWNAKQNAITTGTSLQYLRGDLSLATLDKTAVGLSNVPNLDTSNPANISQNASYRFATDAEKSAWNAKQNAITTGTSLQYLRGDLSLATMDKTAVGLSNVTNDQQVSLKFYFSTEGTAAVATSVTSGFTTGFTQNFTPAETADYLIEWYYELSNSSASGGYGSQVSVDGTVYSSSANYPALAAAYMAYSGTIKLNLTAASHTFLIEINRPSGAAAGTVSFRRPRLIIKKV